MDEIKEGDIVWYLHYPTVETKVLVKIKRVYLRSFTDPDYLVEEYLGIRPSWYTSHRKLKPLTPEEKLELATFGKILEVD